MEALAAYRHTQFRGVEELTRVAATLVERFSAERARGSRAPTTITERTVRHYLSEDLLGHPAGQAGTALVFNYANLLRLLAVKKLLAEHWSVLKVKEFMTTLDTTALEQMVGATLRANTDASTGDTQQGSVMPATPVNSVTGEGALIGAASERGMADTSPDPAAPPQQPPPLASLAVESARRAERSSMEWIELAPGLEVKVRRGFRPPRTREERERLVARFWSVVNRHTST
jgi:DNA-binding transcriptional MerR regulator